MSTAATAATIAAFAAVQANKAKTVACEALAHNYQHAGATVEQQQNYASCIAHMHPTEIVGETAILLKVVIVLALVSIPAGAIFGRRELGGADGALIGAAMAPIFVSAISTAGFLVFAGIKFILS